MALLLHKLLTSLFCCLHKSGYVFQPKRALVDFESFVYSWFSVVVMERCIQHDVLSLFIRVKGPVIQTSLFPGLFVGISCFGKVCPILHHLLAESLFLGLIIKIIVQRLTEDEHDFVPVHDPHPLTPGIHGGAMIE